MPKISLVIPVYNSEQYLEECLGSISKQTYQDFEVILVNDGSKDRSGEICNQYAVRDSRFRVIHKENGGVATARNTGIDNVAGDWVVFVDSDDTVLPGYIEDMMMLVDDKTDIVVCDMKGKEKSRIVSKELDASVFDQHPQLLSGSPVNKLFKTKLLRDFKIYFPLGIHTMEDNIFVWLYLLHCKYASISDQNNYNYNQHENSLVRSVHRMEEIHKLTMTIMPLYQDVALHFSLSPIAIAHLDNYFFVACLKRLLISNCKGLTLKKTKNNIGDVVNEMDALINRVWSLKGLTAKDTLVLLLAKWHCVTLLTLYAKMNSRKK